MCGGVFGCGVGWVPPTVCVLAQVIGTSDAYVLQLKCKGCSFLRACVGIVTMSSCCTAIWVDLVCLMHVLVSYVAARFGPIRGLGH
jgi:hypothetical protein